MKKKKIINVSSKYNTMIIAITVGVLAVILIGGFLIRPAWSDLQTLGTEIPKEQQARDLKKQDYENLKKAETFFKDNPQTVEQVNTTVPISPEVPSILVMLESLAKQNGVFLTSFSPQQLGAPGSQGASSSGDKSSAGTANPPGTNSVEVTANFRGPYPSLLNFLYNLERSQRITDVKSITVTSTSGSLEGNITFKSYYVQVPGGPTVGTPATTSTQGGAK
jgi:hypothetical protein